VEALARPDAAVSDPWRVGRGEARTGGGFRRPGFPGYSSLAGDVAAMKPAWRRYGASWLIPPPHRFHRVGTTVTDPHIWLALTLEFAHAVPGAA